MSVLQYGQGQEEESAGAIAFHTRDVSRDWKVLVVATEQKNYKCTFVFVCIYYYFLKVDFGLNYLCGVVSLPKVNVHPT